MDIDRNEMKKKLSKLINKTISDKIEEGIYKFSNDYAISKDTPYLLQSIYETKFDEIYDLLSNKDSKYLLNALNNKIINPENLASMQPDELNPDKYESIKRKKAIEENKINNSGSSDAFTCTKCKKSKCKIEQKQTRSGDEPPTTFVTCLECNHVFKF